MVKYLNMKASAKKKFKIRYQPKNKLENITKLPFLKLVYLSIAINVVVIVAVLVFKKYIPPQVPVFYGLPEGENQLANMEELIIPSMASLLVILINISLASLLKNDYLKRTMIIVSLTISLLSLITTLEIVFLVGSL
jgi:hypothetical protein